MSDQFHCGPRRFRKCRRDYYHLSASGERSCARTDRQDRAKSDSTVTPCGRRYLRPEFSLVCITPDHPQWSARSGAGKNSRSTGLQRTAGKVADTE
jgi:hypothetical protein